MHSADDLYTGQRNRSFVLPFRIRKLLNCMFRSRTFLHLHRLRYANDDGRQSQILDFARRIRFCSVSIDDLLRLKYMLEHEINTYI